MAQKKRQPIRVSEATMSLADWQEKLISKARAFVKAESDANLRELKVAAYGYGHWVAELEKAKKREQRFVPEGK